MSGIIAQNSGRHTGLVKAASAAGTWNLIKTYTASSSDDLTFVSGTDDVDFSAYNVFVFKFIDIHPETDTADFQVNFRDEDTNYDATKTTHLFVASHTEADATSLARNDTYSIANSTAVQVLAYSMGGDADASLCGELKIWNPSSTTFTKNFGSRVAYMHSAPAAYDAYMGGYCTQDDPSKAIDGVQFTMSSDSIQSGQISLYGIT